jgi:glycosyltransferase involved in cell wall biosynthesis
MIVKNQLWNDARVKKEALSLAAAGYAVTVIALPEEGKPASEEWEGCRILRPPNTPRWVKGARKAVDGYQAPGVKPGALKRLVMALRRNRTRIALTNAKRLVQHDLRLLSAALRTGADVYHAHDLDTLFVAWLAALLRRARLVYDSHELWLESQRYLFEDGRTARWTARITERSLAHRADLVIAVTGMRGMHMRSMYPDMPEPVIVKNCPHVVEEVSDTGYLRARTGCSPDSTIVLYQGILSASRGLEELIEAASILRLRGMDKVVFALMGTDYLHGELSEMVRARDLGDRVHIFAPVPSETLPEVTVSADVGMILFRNSCLNHFHSLPNKLFEYMMAGLPMVASGFPEMAAVIEGAGCGMLVEPSDPEGIAQALLHLASNPRERVEMGARGRAAALTEYNWKRQERVLLDSYQGILN